MAQAGEELPLNRAHSRNASRRWQNATAKTTLTRPALIDQVIRGRVSTQFANASGGFTQSLLCLCAQLKCRFQPRALRQTERAR